MGTIVATRAYLPSKFRHFDADINRDNLMTHLPSPIAQVKALVRLKLKLRDKRCFIDDDDCSAAVSLVQIPQVPTLITLIFLTLEDGFPAFVPLMHLTLRATWPQDLAKMA